jgi:MSHA biogenesis protein MshO
VTRAHRPHLGFTLIELVVSITISAIVVVFVSMFLTAPLNAYDAQSRRAALVAGPSDAWPRMDADLRASLPNSLRARRNGNFVALEMLSVVDRVRYKTAPAASFTTAGIFNGITLPFNSTAHYLSVNNLGTAGADAYALSGSITPAGATILIVAGVPGGTTVTVNPAPVFAANSPKQSVYLVSGPVTYLCDEGQGTIRRYAGYAIAVNQSSWDAPTDFSGAGIAGTLIARGITTCNFAVSPLGGAQAQTAAVQLTSTATNGDTVTLLHSAHAELIP